MHILPYVTISEALTNSRNKANGICFVMLEKWLCHTKILCTNPLANSYLVPLQINRYHQDNTLILVPFKMELAKYSDIQGWL